MGFFDEHVLAVLNDGNPRSFTTFIGQVGFSHNTLQQHLRRLIVECPVFREKVTGNGFKRPKFVHHIPSKTIKQVIMALEDPHVELVAIPFSRIRHICRFGKSRLLQRNKEGLYASNLPPNQKIRIITALHQ